MNLPIEYIQDSTSYTTLYVSLIGSPRFKGDGIAKLRNNYFLGILWTI